MSEDLIKRTDAIKALHEEWNGGWLEATGEWIADNCEAVLNSLPSADRPQGEWIIHFDDLFPEESSIECSVCHEEQPLGIDDNYCPNCGAKMKGADNGRNAD